MSIKTSDGKLRDCIGSLKTPQMPTIFEETLRNAHGAAFGDRRFPQVSAIELHNLRFEVSVLHSFEPIDSPALLAPSRYGVIVETANGRGQPCCLRSSASKPPSSNFAACAKKAASIPLRKSHSRDTAWKNSTSPAAPIDHFRR